MIKKILCLLLMCLFFPLNSFSATDGTLGTTSTGTIAISLTINSVIKITNMDDITLSYTPGVDTGNLTDSTLFCVYTNNGTGIYSTTVSSANATGTTFRVKDAGTNYIPYTVQWDEDTGFGSPTTLSSGVQATGITGAHTSSETCSGTDVAALRITFTEANLTAAAQGSYTDTLTAVVAPE